MKTILVLEENLEARELLSKMLVRKGYRVYQAEDETAALTALRPSDHIDLVLAGATKRNRAGFLASLRTRGPSIPVILLTDRGEAIYRKQLLTSCFFLLSRPNFSMSTRPTDFNELDRMIFISLMPQRNGIMSSTNS